MARWIWPKQIFFLATSDWCLTCKFSFRNTLARNIWTSDCERLREASPVPDSSHWGGVTEWSQAIETVSSGHPHDHWPSLAIVDNCHWPGSLATAHSSPITDTSVCSIFTRPCSSTCSPARVLQHWAGLGWLLRVGCTPCSRLGHWAWCACSSAPSASQDVRGRGGREHIVGC